MVGTTRRYWASPVMINVNIYKNSVFGNDCLKQHVKPIIYRMACTKYSRLALEMTFSSIARGVDSAIV
jgi:hypothetical protein